MGKFVNFFKKIGRGIKKGATKVWDWTKNAAQKVGKVIRPVADIAAKIGGAMSALPGKAGAIAKGLAYGANTIKGLTNMLPDSQAKTKINEAINKGVDTGQNAVNRFSEGLTQFNNKAQPWINAGVDISRKIADASDRLGARMPARFPFQ